MNYFDIIILIPLLWFGYRGFKKGLIIELASFVALILGIYCALQFSGITASLISPLFGSETRYMPVIAFALTFVIVVILVHLVAKIADKLAKAIALGFLVRILGVVFGVLKIVFIISIILNLLNRFDIESTIITKDFRNGSVLYDPLCALSEYIFPIVEKLDNFVSSSPDII